jgi:hypothetical protein
MKPITTNQDLIIQYALENNSLWDIFFFGNSTVNGKIYLAILLTLFDPEMRRLNLSLKPSSRKILSSVQQCATVLELRFPRQVDRKT